MDEIFTWKEATDRSLFHLYSAIQHGADGGQPLFYTTAWLWAKVFGDGVLTLRLYSSIAMCAALLVTWLTLRRFYGLWSTAFGVLAFWSTSGVLLEQNVEARFYGLYVLVVALTFHLWARLVTSPSASRWVLLAAFLSQAALVWTHVLGLMYSGLMLGALLLVDAAKGRPRVRLYFSYAAGWLVLLAWLPAIRASMAAGKPHGWIGLPAFAELRTAWLFAAFLPWLRFFKRHSLEAGFQIFMRLAEAVIYIPLVAVFLSGVRSIFRSGWKVIADPRGALLLFAYSLLLAPAVLFCLSHAITPVFVGRYFLPSGIGLSIVLCATADALGADRQMQPNGRRRVVWAGIVVLLLVWPVATVGAVGPMSNSWDYLDVQRLENEIPPDRVLVAGWQEDFVKLMRLGKTQGQYVYLLDWPSALEGPRAFVLDYHLMQAYRNAGYYPGKIQDNKEFLCTHGDFLVLDGPNANTIDNGPAESPDMLKLNWFDRNIRSAPQFQWKILDSFNSSEVKRKLIVVHRQAPLPLCK